MLDDAGTSGSNLVEIFSSVQGEGVYVGATTLFVRFGGRHHRVERQRVRPSDECPAATGGFDLALRRGLPGVRRVAPATAQVAAAEADEDTRAPDLGALSLDRPEDLDKVHAA